MQAVSESYARELGQAAKETSTAVEINGHANLMNPAQDERHVEEYYEYLAVIAEQGPMFSVGSDAHDLRKLQTVSASGKMVERLDLPAERICFSSSGNPGFTTKPSGEHHGNSPKKSSGS